MTLLIFPFQAELEAYLSGLPAVGESVRGIRVLRPEAQPECRLAVCGQGKVEAALACQILADALLPGMVLLLGSATALDPSLEIGALVKADPCIEWDFGAEPPPRFQAAALPVFAGIRAGPVLSGDRNVFDAAQKNALFIRHGALALAWEGAGFHRFLRRSGLPGGEFRLITEAADSGKPSLADLRGRMRNGFAPLHPLIQGL